MASTGEAGAGDAALCIIEHLRAAEASRPHTEGSPIHKALLREQPYASEVLRIRMVVPDSLASLHLRVLQKDVANGCMDPERMGQDRDFAEVELRLPAGWQRLSLPAFLAHLAEPRCLLDPEAADEAEPLFRDGSWTGTLLWDSAVHVSELLLSSEVWQERVRGRSVVELGCGLGLPGQVCALLGAAPVLLTDRGRVAALAEEGCRGNAGLGAAQGVMLEWEAGAVQQFREQHLGGAAPGLVLACDCIFARLFGDTFLLLRVLCALAGPETWAIVALERRPEDGAEDFFTCAQEAGFEARLLARHDRVVLCEMRLRR